MCTHSQGRWVGFLRGGGGDAHSLAGHSCCWGGGREHPGSEGATTRHTLFSEQATPSRFPKKVLRRPSSPSSPSWLQASMAFIGLHRLHGFPSGPAKSLPRPGEPLLPRPPGLDVDHDRAHAPELAAAARLCGRRQHLSDRATQRNGHIAAVVLRWCRPRQNFHRVSPAVIHLTD